MTPFRLVSFSSSRILSSGIDLSTDLGAGGPDFGGVGRPNFWKGDAFDPE
jgi:hypothetical protein